MTFRIVCIVWLLVLSSGLSAQSVDPATPDSVYADYQAVMIGRIAVGLIFPQSVGTLALEVWTDEEIAYARESVQLALDWWASLEPRAELGFVLEVRERIPTQYEPITLTHWQDEHLWIRDVLAALGYEHTDYRAAARMYADDLKVRKNAEQAFLVFIVDASNDADGAFAGGIYAYAQLGGPYLVLTSELGGLGRWYLDVYAAHEIGHIFNALDQYAAANVPCSRTSGRYAVRNGNSEVGDRYCDSDEFSIMRQSYVGYVLRAVDRYARGQVGWLDSDGDTVLDPLDPDPADPKVPYPWHTYVPIVQRWGAGIY